MHHTSASSSTPGPGSNAITGPASILNDSPLQRLFRSYLFIGLPTGVAVGLGVASTMDSGPYEQPSGLVMLALLSVFPMGFLLLVKTGRRLIEFFEGRQHLAEAREAVRSGKITPTFAYAEKGVRRPILVDEDNRKIWVDRQLVSFDDVREVKTDTQLSLRAHTKPNSATAKTWGRINIIVSKGEDPVLTALVENQDRDRAFYRLCNTLGMESG